MTAKNLLSIFDLSAQDIWDYLTLARKLKSEDKPGAPLKGKTLGLIFEKPSTRTTVSFAVAMYQLGGFPLILNAQDLQRKRGETIQDTARTLSRYLDAMMIRAYRHTDIVEFAKWSSVSVINGLTDKEHPCQVLGDILTILEKKKIKSLPGLKGLKITFVGDGNNVANSWIAAASLLGFNFTLARPAGYGPDDEILKKAQNLASKSKGNIIITENPFEGAKDADIIYTDVWTSMGAEAELERRKKVFYSYQVNENLLKSAKKDCLIMHCLPAIRGEEITAELIEDARSIVFDQAENRLHIQKAILIQLLA